MSQSQAKTDSSILLVVLSRGSTHGLTVVSLHYNIPDAMLAEDLEADPDVGF